MEVSVMKRGQDCMHVVLSTWVLLCPWVLKLAGVAGAAAWGTALVGAALMLLVAPQLLAPKAWEEVTTAVLGLALVVAPWMLDFSNRTGPACSAVIAGILMVTLGGWRFAGDRLWIEWRRGRQAV